MTRKQKVLLVSLLALPTLLRPQTDASRCCGSLVRCPPMQNSGLENRNDYLPPPTMLAPPLRPAAGAETNSAALGQSIPEPITPRH